MSSMPSTNGSATRNAASMSFPLSSPRCPSSKTSTSRADRFWPLTATIAALKEFVPENEEGLEDTLQAAVRIAMEYRMDLMNARASLYDVWRQIRVTANALKGVLNLAITNNVYTPPDPGNPFAFLSQAKQFSLAINAELPLVRINERNAFRHGPYQLSTRSENAAIRGRQSENPVA